MPQSPFSPSEGWNRWVCMSINGVALSSSSTAVRISCGDRFMDDIPALYSPWIGRVKPTQIVIARNPPSTLRIDPVTNDDAREDARYTAAPRSEEHTSELQ